MTDFLLITDQFLQSPKFLKHDFNQLIQYLDHYKLLYKSQYGFRKNNFTELDALEFIGI